MKISELQNKLELIKQWYGDEDIIIFNDFSVLIKNKYINIKNISTSQYIKELEKAKDKTLQRLERIENQLKKYK